MDANESLWPTDLLDNEVVLPLAILREQAQALVKLSRGLLIAQVESQGADADLYHHLIIIAPALSYRYKLLSIKHGITVYPASGFFFASELLGRHLGNDHELVDWLRRCLSDDFTKRLLSGLVAQSRVAAQPLGAEPTPET